MQREQCGRSEGLREAREQQSATPPPIFGRRLLPLPLLLVRTLAPDVEASIFSEREQGKRGQFEPTEALRGHVSFNLASLRRRRLVLALSRV